MSSRSTLPNTVPVAGFLNSVLAVKLPVIGILVLFVLAAAIGGEVTDRGILPLVRFISLLMLASALYTSVMVGRYCTYSKKRWLVGQVAAVSIGSGAGFVWSAVSFGVGFILIMFGIALCTVLITGELQRSSVRRRYARKATD